MLVLLDDCLSRTRIFKEKYANITCFATAEEIINFLSKNTNHIDALFLDHDLNGETNVDSNRVDTGMEVVRFLSKNTKDIGLVIVHSMNESASLEMVGSLKKSGYNVQRINFLKLERLHLLKR